MWGKAHTIGAAEDIHQFRQQKSRRTRPFRFGRKISFPYNKHTRVRYCGEFFL